MSGTVTRTHGSQYHEDYLDSGLARIKAGDRPLTVGSYLSYTLRGKAKSYAARYEAALNRSLAADPTVVGVGSASGRLAFLRKRDLRKAKVELVRFVQTPYGWARPEAEIEREIADAERAIEDGQARWAATGSSRR